MTVLVDVSLAYGDVPIRRGHAPRGKYARAQKCLRLDFGFRCVYCIAHESEVAPGARCGNYQIDHFVPQHARADLVNVYSNLMWSCRECNSVKRGTWPTTEEQAMGFRLVDACAEPLGAHLAMRDLRVEPLSTAGEYMVEVLTLNSPIQIHRRQTRREKVTAYELALSLLGILKADPATAGRADIAIKLPGLASQLHQIAVELGRVPPWDAPTTCNCPRPRRPRRPRTRRERQRQSRSRGP